VLFIWYHFYMNNDINVMEKIDQYRKTQHRATNFVMASIAGLLIGGGLCASSFSGASAGIVFGLIILGISALIFFFSMIVLLTSSWHVSYLQKQIKKGAGTDMSDGRKVANTLLSVILALGALLLVGAGVCFSILSLGSW
jgi:hypothetical protein